MTLSREGEGMTKKYVCTFFAFIDLDHNGHAYSLAVKRTARAMMRNMLGYTSKLTRIFPRLSIP